MNLIAIVIIFPITQCSQVYVRILMILIELTDLLLLVQFEIRFYYSSFSLHSVQSIELHGEFTASYYQLIMISIKKTTKQKNIQSHSKSANYLFACIRILFMEFSIFEWLQSLIASKRTVYLLPWHHSKKMYEEFVLQISNEQIDRG